MLEIDHIFACTAEGRDILRHFSLVIQEGEIHVIMGPNGSGKSTLARILAGDYIYKVTQGSIKFCGKDLLSMGPDERAREGLFVGFQYPPEIRGISTFSFLHSAYNSLFSPPISEEDFRALVVSQLKKMQWSNFVLDRGVNDGCSGGEKKRSEILQMLLLNPKFILLDEIDSGLDIDSLQSIGQEIQRFMESDIKKSMLLITHYPRLLSYVLPHHVHVIVDGTIVESGGAELATQLENTGYGRSY